jgi:dethiobiotin synthetase
MTRKIAIAGIHTGIGKTIASAVIAEALGADYWKPVQAGLEERDTVQVQSLLSNGQARVHAEAVLLTQPLSPHAAAAIDKVTVDFRTFKWPETNKTLLVETAGGLLSPMSDTTTMADFISYNQLPAILVSQNYLGSINHTLLTIEVMRSRGIPILGLVVNGASNQASEDYLEQYSGLKICARIPHFETIDREATRQCAEQIREQLLEITGGGSMKDQAKK